MKYFSVQNLNVFSLPLVQKVKKKEKIIVNIPPVLCIEKLGFVYFVSSDIYAYIFFEKLYYLKTGKNNIFKKNINLYNFILCNDFRI